MSGMFILVHLENKVIISRLLGYIFTIASFLWVEIGLSVYWPVSCGGNEFLGSILNLSSYISNKFSVFHAQIGSRVSGSERVNQFEHEN